MWEYGHWEDYKPARKEWPRTDSIHINCKCVCKIVKRMMNWMKCSLRNGWPKMGRRNSGALFNVSAREFFFLFYFFLILIWKRPTATYSILFGNDLDKLINGKKGPVEWNWGTGIWLSKIVTFRWPGVCPRGRCWSNKLIGAFFTLSSKCGEHLKN